MVFRRVSQVLSTHPRVALLVCGARFCRNCPHGRQLVIEKINLVLLLRRACLRNSIYRTLAH